MAATHRLEKYICVGGFLEAVSQGGVDVCVVLELAEECVGVVAEEDVGSGFYGEVVVYFVVYVGAEINVFI